MGKKGKGRKMTCLHCADWDIEEIREGVARLQKTLNWYDKRGGLLPYDWVSYGHPEVMTLLRLCRVDFEGNLKKLDKRGAWR